MSKKGFTIPGREFTWHRVTFQATFNMHVLEDEDPLTVARQLMRLWAGDDAEEAHLVSIDDKIIEKEQVVGLTRRYTRTPFPDDGCYVRADGECIGTDCMHTRKEVLHEHALPADRDSDA